MYADRYGPKRVNPGSLTASVGIVGGLLTAALLSSPYIATHFKDPGIRIYEVDPAPPPPPPDPTPPPPESRTQVQPRVDQPRQLVPTVTEPETPYVSPPVAGTIVDPGTLDGIGTGVVPFDPPKPPPPPVLTKADIDPRYARDFQPTYPAAEQRAGNEGVVTLKVLVGVDGRVRQVERVAAASDEFWRVTERQALSRWRFKPATRDGIPVESWRTMNVRFTLAGQD